MEFGEKLCEINGVVFSYDKRGICDKRIVSACCNKRLADAKI